MQRQRPSGKESRFPRTILLLTTLAAFPGVANAVPTVDLSWSACAPIVADIPAGAPGTYSMYASVTGQEEAHKAYEVWLLLSDASIGLPDAWAFHGTGCQGSGRVSVAFAPRGFEAASCPAFKGPTNSLEMSAFNQPNVESGYPTSIGRVVLVSSYNDGFYDPDPAKRYFLGRIDFDHSASVLGEAGEGECGGFATGITFRLQPNKVNWLDMSNMERAFARGNEQLTFAGGAGPGVTVPVASVTWGQIKAQYRQ